MNYDKLPHLIMGSIFMGCGFLLAFVLPNLLPPFMKPLCLILGASIALWGCLQAMLLGHAPFYILALIFAPFMIAWDIFGMPVKNTGGNVTWEGQRVIGYWKRADRVVLVREYTEYIQCIEGKSEFAQPGKLEKIGVVLEAGRVPEMPLDKERLHKAVNRWGEDDKLMNRARTAGRTRDHVPATGPPLRLDSPTKDEVYFAHDFMDLLWKLRRGTEREDIIQLAIWYALENDRLFHHRPA